MVTILIRPNTIFWCICAVSYSFEWMAHFIIKIRFAPRPVAHNNLTIITILDDQSITSSQLIVFLLVVNFIYVFFRWFTTHPATIPFLSFTPALPSCLHEVVPECRSKHQQHFCWTWVANAVAVNTGFDCPVFLRTYYHNRLLRDSLVFWDIAHWHLPTIPSLYSATNIGG